MKQPRQASDLLDPAVLLSRALVSSWQSGDCSGRKEKEPVSGLELAPQIFEKTMFEVGASWA